MFLLVPTVRPVAIFSEYKWSYILYDGIFEIYKSSEQTLYKPFYPIFWANIPSEEPGRPGLNVQFPDSPHCMHWNPEGLALSPHSLTPLHSRCIPHAHTCIARLNFLALLMPTPLSSISSYSLTIPQAYMWHIFLGSYKYWHEPWMQACGCCGVPISLNMVQGWSTF